MQPSPERRHETEEDPMGAARTRAATAERRLLTRLLDEAYEETGWIDRTLRRSLRGVTVQEALERPAEGRHNIWEHVVHLTYWKHVLHRRITKSEPAPWDEPGRDWFARDTANAREWARDKRRLAETHERVVEAAHGKRHLEARDVEYLVGAALHDVYHAGQIELTRRLVRQRAKTRP